MTGFEYVGSHIVRIRWILDAAIALEVTNGWGEQACRLTLIKAVRGGICRSPGEERKAIGVRSCPLTHAATNQIKWLGVSVMIKKDTRSKSPATREPLPASPVPTGIAAAVCFALYGLPPPAAADSADQPQGVLQEVTVTATRRTETIESVPYSLSVISADQISASGVTDLATLATQVPGLSMYDYGARFAGATTPIIRGINATGSPPGAFAPSSKTPWARISAIRRSTGTFSWTT